MSARGIVARAWCNAELAAWLGAQMVPAELLATAPKAPFPLIEIRTRGPTLLWRVDPLAFRNAGNAQG